MVAFPHEVFFDDVGRRNRQLASPLLEMNGAVAVNGIAEGAVAVALHRGIGRDEVVFQKFVQCL